MPSTKLDRLHSFAMASHIAPKSHKEILGWLEMQLAAQRHDLELHHHAMLKEFSLNIKTWGAECSKIAYPACFTGDDGCEDAMEEVIDLEISSHPTEQEQGAHRNGSRAADERDSDGKARPIISPEDVVQEPLDTAQVVRTTVETQRALPRKTTNTTQEKHRWSLSDDHLLEQARNIKRHASSRRTTISAAMEKVQGSVWGSQYCMRIVRQGWFDRFCSLIIMVHSLVVLADVEYQAVTLEPSHQAFVIAQCVFTALYTGELIIRIIGYGRSFVSSLDKFWNLFDSVVVFCSILDVLLVVVVQLPSSAMVVVRVMRLLRIAKVLRLVRFLRKIRTLAYALAQTLPALLWSTLLCAILMYVFAIILTSAATDLRVTNPDHESIYRWWGTFGRSMLTLFATISGGIDWLNACEELYDLDSPWYVAVYLLYIVFMTFAVLNVITGFFCEHAFEMARCDKDTLIQEQLRHKQTYIDHFEAYFKLIDTDGSGTISFSELERMMEDDAMQAYLSHLNISGGSAWQIFRLIDKDGGGSVDIDEFVTGLLTMKGPARNLDLRSLHHDLNRFMTVLSDFMKFTDSKLSIIHETEQDILKAEEFVTRKMTIIGRPSM
eukprot:TRINITY_DN34308_c0_g1_i1.p1 TRINITY_DN34308_c0_g1~~TRINITY_DN34308_c0_g1_i1.p1  ORF type:complete len:607 (+),score=83.92 TRINITY_DN34308_c0_g1_i1:47-1867(+)